VLHRRLAAQGAGWLGYGMLGAAAALLKQLDPIFGAHALRPRVVAAHRHAGTARRQPQTHMHTCARSRITTPPRMHARTYARTQT
jgi:hypothetical protein